MIEKTTPENLREQINTYVKNPSTLVANAQGAWRDALDENRRHVTGATSTRWMTLKIANEYVLEGWGAAQSFGDYIDNGLFHLYWRHEKLAQAVEKVICAFVDDYIETDKELHSDDR